jgi:class 3 adenylate cyclase/CHASE3 domain sensor protein
MLSDPRHPAHEMPRLMLPLAPLVDLVARLRASVLLKLLAGFLLSALLLLGMGILSLVVINRMNDRVEDLNAARDRQDRGRQMIYLVTAQSHYRAMSLLTGNPVWTDRIANAKADFQQQLDAMAADGVPGDADFVERMRAVDQRFAASGEQVASLHGSGDHVAAISQHIGGEHEISHELEAGLAGLIDDSNERVATATSDFKSDRGTLRILLATFSGVSFVLALFLGMVLSGSLIRPVRRMGHVLAGIAGGDFSQRVNVPNRDELGTLGEHVNHMSGELAALYAQLETVNQNLQATVDAQVIALERANNLKRYLSPQVADSILRGGSEVTLSSRRRNLTTFFSDVRGFTEMSERVEPEELVEKLNEYLSAMTDIVFKYGGTLDKYIGDSIMVFFGDPIPHEDHAERAVRMALEMRTKLEELQERWAIRREHSLTVGIGISTGWVTVGNIGSATRTEYTVMGNDVNLASRLAGLAKPGQILVSERTMVGLHDTVTASEVEQVEMKGINRPIRVYEVREELTPSPW